MLACTDCSRQMSNSGCLLHQLHQAHPHSWPVAVVKPKASSCCMNCLRLRGPNVPAWQAPWSPRAVAKPKAACRCTNCLRLRGALRQTAFLGCLKLVDGAGMPALIA